MLGLTHFRKMLDISPRVITLIVESQSLTGHYLVIGDSEAVNAEVCRLREIARRYEGTLILPDGTREVFAFEWELDENKKLISDSSGNRFKHSWARTVIKGDKIIAKYIDGYSYRKL